MGLLSSFLDNYKAGLGVIGDALSGNKKKQTSTSSKKTTTTKTPTLANPNPLASTSPVINVNVKPTLGTNTSSSNKQSVVYTQPTQNKPLIDNAANKNLSAIIKGAEYASQGLPLIPVSTGASSSSSNQATSTPVISNIPSTPSTSATTNVTPSVSIPGVGGTSTSVSGTTAENPYKLDLSDILAAYTKSAEAQKKSISDSTSAQKKMLADTLAAQLKSIDTSESIQKENLLTSLKRFQEDTAAARKQQQSSFNASRADLEAQAFMADRRAAQSAAARGLGGSGLQQLAQLQNMINQSGEINQLAASNTETLNNLAQVLARQEVDTTTNINNLARELQEKRETLTTEQKNTINALIAEEANKLNEIETNTTSLKEQLKYQEAVRAENARTQAEQFAAEMQAQNASIAAQYDLYNRQVQDENKALLDLTTSGMAGVVADYSNLIKSAANSSTKSKPAKALEENNQAVQAKYNEAISALAAIYGGSGLSQSYLDTYRKQLDDVYSQYYKG